MNPLLSILGVSKFLKMRHYFFNVYRQFSLPSFKPFSDSFLQYSDNVAVVDHIGAFTYKDVLNSSFLLAKKIEEFFPYCKENGERISFLCSNDATYVTVLLSCWITGNTAVPLCNSHPESLLEYYIKDSQSRLVISNKEFENPMRNIASKLNTPFLTIDHDVYKWTSIAPTKFLSKELSEKRALIIYTSGTTGPPKGVVLTHANLHTQISAVVRFWDISSEDSILHALPLHHIHGIMNALLCPLKVGGSVVMQKKFNTLQAWEYFLNLNPENPRVNLFFAVPTMYAKLCEAFGVLNKGETYSKERCLDTMRLMCSGSMSLPVPVFHRWEAITGHRLVERFGMSEIGMALSNPLNGLRMAGFVGVPLPDVEVKIRRYDSPNSYTDVVTANFEDVNVLSGSEGESGELLIKGPNVFREYYNREKATAETFTSNNWFKTGDTACFESGAFKILGRTSVDIIKSGGYKISALQVESCLLRHPDVAECTVFGLPDNIWGERVAALISFHPGKKVQDSDMKIFCLQFLPKYSVPTLIKHVDSIPRNVMGKVNKKELKSSFK